MNVGIEGFETHFKHSHQPTNTIIHLWVAKAMYEGSDLLG